MDDWSDLGVLRAVSEEGSLSAAARRLKVSQPTVSRRLADLERRLGVSLFDRGRGGATPTAIGQTMLDNVRRMGLEADAIARLVAAGEAGLAGDVIISAAEGIGSIWLPPVLAELRARHPGVVPHLQITMRTANLARREADIAIRMGGPGEQASLIARRVVRYGFGFYGSPAYFDRKGRPQHPADLAEHDIIVGQYPVDRDWPMMLGEDGLDAKAPVMGQIAMVADLPGAIAQAAKSGLGLGVIAHWRAAVTGGLEEVLAEWPPPCLDVWLVAHEDLRRNARIRLVYDFLAEKLAANADWFLTGGRARAPAPKDVPV